MGYRSDVAFTIRFEHDGESTAELTLEERKKSFYTFLTEAKTREDTKVIFTECCEVDEQGEGLAIDEDTLSIKFYNTGVKWYSDYYDVKAFMMLVELAREWSENDKFIGFLYTRFGEELEDCEEWSGGNYSHQWLGISRQIYCDWL